MWAQRAHPFDPCGIFYKLLLVFLNRHVIAILCTSTELTCQWISQMFDNNREMVGLWSLGFQPGLWWCVYSRLFCSKLYLSQSSSLFLLTASLSNSHSLYSATLRTHSQLSHASPHLFPISVPPYPLQHTPRSSTDLPLFPVVFQFWTPYKTSLNLTASWSQAPNCIPGSLFPLYPSPVAFPFM